MKNFIFLIVCACLSSCFHRESKISVLERAIMRVQDSQGKTVEIALSPGVMESFKGWLNANSEKWNACYSSPLPFSQFSITLNFDGGKTAVVRLLANHGDGVSTLESLSLPYGGGPQPCGLMTLTPEDLRVLKKLLLVDEFKEIAAP